MNSNKYNKGRKPIRPQAPAEAPAEAPAGEPQGAMPGSAPRPARAPGKNTRPPFEQRRPADWSTWVYRHRVGLLVTVVVYLTAAVVFMTYKVMRSPDRNDTTAIELADPVQQEEIVTPEEEKQEIEQLEETPYERTSNRISNLNSSLNAGLKDDKGARASDIYKEAERVQQQMAADREAYDRAMAGLASSSDRGKRSTDQSSSSTSSSASSQGDSGKREDALVKGNVTVSYDLPPRTAVYLHVPAYQCKGGGEVIVAITVNRNGKVLAASVSKATSGADPCILEMAVKAALASSFNVSTTAPEKQRGTITYMFVAQKE